MTRQFSKTLLEADIQPGEKQTASDYVENLRKYERLKDKIADHKQFLYSLSNARSGFNQQNPELENEFDELQKSVNERILQLKNAIEKAKDREFSDKRLTEFIEKVESECSGFVNVVKESGAFLYRGVNETRNAFFGKTRTDRKLSKFSEGEIYQKSLNHLLTVTGFEANKSNSIPCSPSISTADRYGQTKYIIFPKNGFKFTWFKTNTDSISEHNLKRLYDPVKLAKFVSNIKTIVQQTYNTDVNSEEFKKYSYEIQRLILLAMSDPSMSKYYTPEEMVNDIIEHLDVYKSMFEPHNSKLVISDDTRLELLNPEKFLEMYMPMKTHLIDAMKYKVRTILISGEYYALSYEIFDKILVKRYFS